MPKLLTVQEAATTLRVNEQTIWKRIKDGTLPANKFGRRWLISEDQVVALMGAKQPEDAHE